MKKALINKNTGYVNNIIEIAENSTYKPPIDYEIIDLPKGVNIEIGGTYDKNAGVFTAREPEPAPIVYDIATIAADVAKLKTDILTVTADVTNLKTIEVAK